ncbi:MAG: serine/threonine-protein kinase [Gemmataceae bacterium]
MPEPPRTGDAVLELVRKSALVADETLDAFVEQSASVLTDASPEAIAAQLVDAGHLTPFQAKAILLGKTRGFHLGPYRILDQIGSGGMGHVFLAEHEHMRRRVAVKVLPPRLALDKVMVERFYREARAVAALDHPNIIRAHDVACDRTTHYLVMEYVEGRSLAQRLAASQGPIPIGEACSYILQAAAALQHAHTKGVVHRDIKPGNILVDREGVVKVLDMGLARFFDDDRDRITEDLDKGTVMGTADYVAPEQLLDSATADNRADIYSLGATFYHLVTGRPPFEGSTTAKLVAHQLKPLRPAHEVREEVPEEVSAIIERMMAKDPADRYQAAGDIIPELLPFVGPVADQSGMPSGLLPLHIAAAVGQNSGVFSSVLIPPTSDAETEIIDDEPPKRGSRKKNIALGILVGIVLLGTALIVTFAFLDNPQASHTPSPVPNPPPADEKKHDPKPPPSKPSDLPDKLTHAFHLDNAKTNVEVALFTPGDAQLITAGTDKLIRVWDAATGSPIRKLEGHTQSVRAISLLPDGRRLISASHDKSLKLWDITTGECLNTYPGSAPVVAVVALPDGRRFLSSATDGTICLWDLDAKEPLKKYGQAPLPVYGLAVTRDGRRAVAGLWDARRNAAKPEDLPKLPPVSVWTFEVETGKELKRLVTDTSVSHIDLAPNGREAVFGTNIGITLWDIDTGRFRVCAGVSRRTTAATFTRDGRHALSTGHDSTLTLWDVAQGKAIAGEPGLPGPGFNVAVSHDGKRAIVVGASGGAEMWKLPASVVPPPRNDALPRPLTTLVSPSGTPEDLIFTANGTQIIGAFQGSQHLMVWDAATGNEINRLKLPDKVTMTRALALLPGDRLVSCSATDSTVRVWDLKTGEQIRGLRADKVSGYTSVSTTTDGRVFATATDKTVRVWNADSEREIGRFSLKSDGRGIIVTPDGSRFVVGCADKSVRLWDVAKKAEVRNIMTDPIVWRLALSPDHRSVCFGTSSGVVLWNLDTFDTRFLSGAEKYIDGVTFTRDGRFVLGGSIDRGLYTWDLETGKCLGKVTEHTNNLRSVVLSPNGKRLATSSTDQTGIVWQLPEAMGK